MDVDGSGAGAPRGLVLPLYVAEWAEEVLDRCLALLGNLDSGGPGQRGTDLAAGGAGGGGGGGRSGGEAMGRTSSFLLTVGCVGALADQECMQLCMLLHTCHEHEVFAGRGWRPWAVRAACR